MVQRNSMQTKRINWGYKKLLHKRYYTKYELEAIIIKISVFYAINIKSLE